MEKLENMIVPRGVAVGLLVTAKARTKVQEALDSESPLFLVRPEDQKSHKEYLRVSDIDKFAKFIEEHGGILAKHQEGKKSLTERVAEHAKIIPNGTKLEIVTPDYREQQREVEKERAAQIIPLAMIEKPEYTVQKKVLLPIEHTPEATPLNRDGYMRLRKELLASLIVQKAEEDKTKAEKIKAKREQDLDLPLSTLEKSYKVVDMAIPASRAREVYHIPNEKISKYLGAPGFYGGSALGHFAKKVIEVLEQLIASSGARTSGAQTKA